MLAQDNQRDGSAVNAQLQPEPNTPFAGFAPLGEDLQRAGELERGREIAATREATQRRLRLQSEELRRFHQQICLRVNERVLAQRAQQQARDKQIDAKLARLLQAPSAAATEDTTATATTSEKPRALRLSRSAHVDALLGRRRDQLQGSGATLSLVDKALRSDAQAREMLLASTRVARVRASRDCEATALDELDAEGDNQTNDGNGRERAAADDLALPVKQRTELYAAVRRRYMAMEREHVKQRADAGASAVRKQPAARPAAASKSSSSRLASDERRTDTLVKVVDASAGCEIKLQRQTARSSSTPWRNSPAQPPESQSTATSAAKSHAKASTTHERFLTALQEQLGTPALCSCGGAGGKGRRSAECANNCEFYRQPKRKERAATSVCKQHGAAT